MTIRFTVWFLMQVNFKLHTQCAAVKTQNLLMKTPPQRFTFRFF